MENLLAGDMDHIVSHTLDVWEDLRDSQIFMTGGTGFFGCWLLDSFAWASSHLNLNSSIVVLTRSPEAFRAKVPHLAAHPSIHLLKGDVRSFSFPEGRFSHVIHCATETSASQNRDYPLQMLDTIVEGTRHVLDFAVSSGARRFLLTSSGAVYGTQPSEITHLPESFSGGPDQTDTRWVYGEGKRLAELLCVLYAKEKGLECLIARCFAFVGPRLPLGAHFAIGNFIRDCMHGKAIEIRGDGTPYRSYLYAADLAIWLWTILTRGQTCWPYNVGSESDLSIAKLANTVARALGVEVACNVLTVPKAGAHPERYVPDTSRARQELGLREWVPLDEAIRRTSAWSYASPV